MALGPEKVAETDKRKERTAQEKVDGKRDTPGRSTNEPSGTKESAMPMDEQAVANLLDASQKEREVREEGLSAERDH